MRRWWRGEGGGKELVGRRRRWGGGGAGSYANAPNSSPANLQKQQNAAFNYLFSCLGDVFTGDTKRCEEKEKKNVCEIHLRFFFKSVSKLISWGGT